MILNKSDLTDYALDIGVWDCLCEMSGNNPNETEEVDIVKVKKACNTRAD